ncbi:hypothetical protein B0H11DRAFT_1728061 [Mycena galericulata]|nr:hypothetical protein B0H11DRAFT_1728061 [Mycena galericulata]
MSEKAAFEEGLCSKGLRFRWTQSRRIFRPCIHRHLSSCRCRILLGYHHATWCGARLREQSNYVTRAVNPSRISKTFTDAALREVVDNIATSMGSLLEIVNPFSFTQVGNFCASEKLYRMNLFHQTNIKYF